MLAAFLQVAESRSFSAAAATLHLSQPAVSKRIALLEQRSGRKLFDRIGRRVHLTEAGHTLLPYARRVLQDLEDGRRALSLLADRVAGRLSVGTSHHIGLHRLPPVLKRYTHEFPDVDLDLHFMDSEVACQGVLAGRLELGIVTLPLEPLPALEHAPVWPDPLAVVVAPEHPLARQRRVRLKDLAGHPAVLPDEATYTHRIRWVYVASSGSTAGSSRPSSRATASRPACAWPPTTWRRSRCWWPSAWAGACCRARCWTAACARWRPPGSRRRARWAWCGTATARSRRRRSA
jgi:DNA-binding transcriptional LysR family regulator